MEIWKDIEGFEGKYRISSCGNVWSITKGLRKINPSMLGYLSIALSKNNKRVNTSIHRLVAEHFIDNPNNLPLVDHINNIRHDNNVINLRWVDYIGNSSNMKKNTVYSVKGYITYTEEEIQNEVWVDATNIIDELKTKEYFMVSSLGRYRYCKKNNRLGTKSIQTISPKHTVGYPSTTIRGEGFKLTYPIHKLVALCFLRKPNDGEVIDHIDSNTNNPRLSNLQIITIQENNRKANRKDDKGINNGMSKHTHDEILEVLDMFYFKKKSKSDIGRNINMNISTVTRIVSGETYENIYEKFMNENPILPVRPTQSELQSIARKGVPQKKLTCPYCDKIGGNTNMLRYHFDNCKYKK